MYLSTESDPLAKLAQYSKAPGILWKGWTMPPYEPALTLFSEPDRSAAKKAAVIVIVFLMLCLKGQPGFGSVVGTAIGAALTYVLNIWVKQQEPEKISTYGLAIVVLLSVIFVPLVVGGFPAYEFFERALSSEFAPVIVGVVLAFIFWYLKARILDKNVINLTTLGWAVKTAVLVGIIVSVVIWMPDFSGNT
jgi:hypothetical protein